MHLFQRHPKVDLNKNDLLRLLSYLEGELQARDIAIASLKVCVHQLQIVLTSRETLIVLTILYQYGFGVRIIFSLKYYRCDKII